MSKASVSFDIIKSELMQDDEFKSEYEKLQPRYEIISQIIEARKARNMTQAELANKIGVKQCMISHYISGRSMPALDTLSRICTVLDLDANEILCVERTNY